MNELRTAATKLRDEGYSYAMISEKLGVAKSTMHYWFRERPFTPNYKVVERIKYGPLKNGARMHNRRVEEIAKLKSIGVNEVGELSKRDLWMLGIGLYIGEGAKTVECVRIANSDPAVIKIAIRWLKEACGLPDENIVITLHLYPDNDIEESFHYWQRVSGLPRSSFRKTQIDGRQNKKASNKRKLPHGTAHVRVIANGDQTKGVALFRKICGWIAGALK